MTVRLAVFLAEQMLRVPPGVAILLRRAQSGKVGAFESVVSDVAERTGHPVHWYEPAGSDRGAVFRRDYEMVEAADSVVAFFAPDRVMEGGTGHIVESALARERPVAAWTVTPGGIERIGEYEPREEPH